MNKYSYYCSAWAHTAALKCPTELCANVATWRSVRSTGRLWHVTPKVNHSRPHPQRPRLNDRLQKPNRTRNLSGHHPPKSVFRQNCSNAAGESKICTPLVAILVPICTKFWVWYHIRTNLLLSSWYHHLESWNKTKIKIKLVKNFALIHLF